MSPAPGVTPRGLYLEKVTAQRRGEKLQAANAQIAQLQSQQSSGQPTNRFQSLDAYAAAEGQNAAQTLAGQEALAATEAAPAPQQDAGQAGHPAMQRLATNQWDGYTGQLNRAQAAQGNADVWVTVPVDKVEVKPDGRGHAAPVFATTQGYRPRPGESAGSVPPTMKVPH